MEQLTHVLNRPLTLSDASRSSSSYRVVIPSVNENSLSRFTVLRYVLFTQFQLHLPRIFPSFLQAPPPQALLGIDCHRNTDEELSLDIKYFTKEMHVFIGYLVALKVESKLQRRTQLDWTSQDQRNLLTIAFGVWHSTEWESVTKRKFFAKAQMKTVGNKLSFSSLLVIELSETIKNCFPIILEIIRTYFSCFVVSHFISIDNLVWLHTEQE